MGFLDNYEDVATRIKRLHATHPSNRVETSIIDFNAEKGYILVECRIFREFEDEKPSAIDYAFGRVESYNAQMKRWFVEDTVTSAIGRCAGLLLGTDVRPTLQNMQQVESMPAAFVNEIIEDPWNKPFAQVTVTTTREEGFSTASQAIGEIQSQLGGEIQSESPICAHGHMILKEGTSPKTGKAYHGYVCPEKVKAKQCSPMWMVLGSDGKWKPQV
tara:strand:- start:271 stop:918 length:648 start_codon:yes stop_codon:yes gene_type:complete